MGVKVHTQSPALLGCLLRTGCLSKSWNVLPSARSLQATSPGEDKPMSESGAHRAATFM